MNTFFDTRYFKTKLSCTNCRFITTWSLSPRWDRCRPRPARSRAAQQAARAASSVVTVPSPAADRRASHTLRGTGPWCLKIGDRRARTPAGAEKGPRWAVPTPTGPEARALAAAVTGAWAPLKGHVSWGPCTAAGLRTDAGHDVQQTRGLSTSDALRHGSRPWSGRRPTVGLAGRRPLSRAVSGKAGTGAPPPGRPQGYSPGALRHTAGALATAGPRWALWPSES